MNTFRFVASSIAWLCFFIVGPQAQSQDVPSEARDTSYALEAGKVEMGIITGIYIISTEEGTEFGPAEYYPGPLWLIGGEVAVGLSSHIALQFGASRADYENDLYWRPAIPHNPYRATADILSFWGGVRYEFRQPAARIRPYIGGGVVATDFANVERGLKYLCLDDTCEAAVPELFDKTKTAAFVDPGINFLIGPAWGIRGGLWMTMHRGDESAADDSDPYQGFSFRPIGSEPNEGFSLRPSPRDLFWHVQFYVGAFYRWN